MDDWRLSRAGYPRIVRCSEFSRLGKSLLASAYEKVFPITRVTIPVNSPSATTSQGDLPRMPARKARA